MWYKKIKNMKKKSAVLWGLVVLTSVWGNIIRSSYAMVGSSVPTVSEVQREQMVLVAVNAFRAKKGLPTLTLNPVIQREAKLHSNDMEKKSVPFGHTGFFDRIKYLKNHIKDYNGGSENVAYYPPNKSASDVVALWLTSSGHRRNILGRYNLTGIGVKRDPRGWYYYTQIFINAPQPQVQTTHFHG